jgi:hypothetical protein
MKVMLSESDHSLILFPIVSEVRVFSVCATRRDSLQDRHDEDRHQPPRPRPQPNARQVLEKYSGLLDRVSYYFPFLPGQNDDGWRATISGFKSPIAISN